MEKNPQQQQWLVNNGWRATQVLEDFSLSLSLLLAIKCCLRLSTCAFCTHWNRTMRRSEHCFWKVTQAGWPLRPYFKASLKKKQVAFKSARTSLPKGDARLRIEHERRRTMQHNATQWNTIQHKTWAHERRESGVRKERNRGPSISGELFFILIGRTEIWLSGKALVRKLKARNLL